MNKEHALMEWIATTRQNAPGLDIDADSLLLQLMIISAQRQAMDASRQCRSSIALFGHSRASKEWLLRALYKDDEAQLPLAMGVTQIARRFSGDTPPADEAFPLRLRLLREAQLAQIFIAHAGQPGDDDTLTAQTFSERLAALQHLRQPQTTPAVTAEEVASVMHFWQSVVPAAQQAIDDSLWYQFVGLLPSLDLSARTRAWSLLWGENPALTQQWQSLTHTLHTLDHRTEVYAPLSLFAAENESNTPVLVQVSARQTASIPRQTLELLTFELVLHRQFCVLDGIDIIDIPASPSDCPATLSASKCRWLIEGFRQQQQPDLMLICNATAQRNEIPQIARTLARWADTTQPQQESGIPGLVWTITPHDERVLQNTQHDEAIQQLVSKSGKRWGTLHAFDQNSLHRLIEWLSHATLPSAHACRLDALQTRLQQKLNALLEPLLHEKPHHSPSPESMIRALQAQVAHHGELLEELLPPPERFDAITAVLHPRETRMTGIIHHDVDLFASSEHAPVQLRVRHDAGTQAWRLWRQHLRGWSSQQTSHGLSIETSQQLARTLIAISYQLKLEQQLRSAAIDHRAGAAQLRAMIGNFIAWLGYADVDETQRPASRVAAGSAIFAAPPTRPTGRLTRLNDQPVHAASRYVYDWLVALYTRAGESQGDIYDLSPEARLALQHLLDKR